MDVPVWVVVPAFNEAGMIGRTLATLQRDDYRVVVVDDGSSDETAAQSRRAGALVVRHPINLGQGAALATGIAFALARGARFVCTFDADGQHDPATIDAMRVALQETGADVALGSRFLGATIAMPPLRRAVLRLAVAFERMHTGLPVTDTHNGLRLFTRDAARRIKIRQPRMAHGSEILSQIAANKLRFVEVPTTIAYTAYSQQKGQKLSNSVKILVDLLYSALAD